MLVHCMSFATICFPIHIVTFLSKVQANLSFSQAPPVLARRYSCSSWEVYLKPDWGTPVTAGHLATGLTGYHLSWERTRNQRPGGTPSFINRQIPVKHYLPHFSDAGGNEEIVAPGLGRRLRPL